MFKHADRKIMFISVVVFYGEEVLRSQTCSRDGHSLQSPINALRASLGRGPKKTILCGCINEDWFLNWRVRACASCGDCGWPRLLVTSISFFSHRAYSTSTSALTFLLDQYDFSFLLCLIYTFSFSSILWF
jgi:hypothetical protein